MIPDQQSYSRATRAALGGLTIQFVLTILMGFCALASQNVALYAATAHLFGGLAIWIVLVILYHQHKLERNEALEAESLAKSQARSATAFDEAGVDLQAAKRRLESIQKYGLNIVAVVVAIYLIGFGTIYLGMLKANLERGTLLTNIAPGFTTTFEGASPALLLVCAMGVAFGAFITARYQAGMTQVEAWQQLRGGASYLVGNCIVALLVAAGLGAWLWDSKMVLVVVSFIIPLIMIILGLETLTIFMLGAYRPRRPGEVPRSSFDSRILGLLTSPKSLAKAMSDAIAYQFGVDVSSSWFFQLVSRSVIKLTVLSIAAVWLMSAVVVTQPHEQTLITRFGKPVPAVSDGNLEDGSAYVFGPGIHFKLPWPMGDEDTFPVQRIQQIEVGSAKTGLKPGAAILWTNSHGAGEGDKEDFFVTAPTAIADNNTIQPGGNVGSGRAAAPGTNLAGAQFVVQFRVTNLYRYFKQSADPARLLRNIAEREINRFFVVHDIDSLVLNDRTVWSKELRDKVQAQVQKDNLGLEVVFVALTAIHPPSNNEVALHFQKQVGAMQEYQTEIEKANREAIRLLASVAGTQERALEIKRAIDELQTAEADLKAAEDKKAPEADELKKKVAVALNRVDDLFAATGTSGDASLRLAEARAYSWERAVSQGAKADRFSSELQAYRQAPELYRMRQYLTVLSEGMSKSRKVILSTRSDVSPTFRIDLKDSSSAISSIMRGN